LLPPPGQEFPHVEELPPPGPDQAVDEKNEPSASDTVNEHAEIGDEKGVMRPTHVWVGDCLCNAAAVQAEAPPEAADKKLLIADYAKDLIEFTNGNDERITFMPGLRIQPRFNDGDENDNSVAIDT
jgi:hypothetical protein